MANNCPEGYRFIFIYKFQKIIFYFLVVKDQKIDQFVVNHVQVQRNVLKVEVLIFMQNVH